MRPANTFSNIQLSNSRALDLFGGTLSYRRILDMCEK